MSDTTCLYVTEGDAIPRITPEKRARAVDVHLPRGCRLKKRATSLDPRAINCRFCLGSRRWRALARKCLRSER